MVAPCRVQEVEQHELPAATRRAEDQLGERPAWQPAAESVVAASRQAVQETRRMRLRILSGPAEVLPAENLCPKAILTSARRENNES